MTAYVKINKRYTATVHAVTDLENYLFREPEQIDLAEFDVTRPFPEDKIEKNNSLNKLIADTRKKLLKANVFAGFNDCPHTCIDLDDEMNTVSVNYRGEQVTFCFIPNHHGQAECVDILRHNSTDQHVISFNGGSGRTDTHGTLNTLMLNDRLNDK